MLQKVNILLDFKWNKCLCRQTPTWQQVHVDVFCMGNNILKTKQTLLKKHTEHCLIPKQNCMQNLEHFDRGHFWEKHLTPFFYQALQFSLKVVELCEPKQN